MAMKHQVGRSVIMTMPGSIDVTEFSRAVSMAEMTGAQFEVWYKYVTSGVGPLSPTLTISLEGSNDLAQWSDLSLSTSFTGEDVAYGIVKSSVVIPWQFVRLRYVLSRSGGSGSLSVNFASAITIFEEA